MRYNGGLLGGALPALLLSDLGNGEFDGAASRQQFREAQSRPQLSSANITICSPTPEKSRKSFLEFEKWWGGFHFMNEQEIRWIVENLFVGNKLSRGEANIEPGRPIDLKAIRSPIIVFACWGDNITPPQQALNWIVDTYADEHEIEIRGQRIIYMVHDKVGHLGIFVSSSIAKKEHAEVTSTMKTIEALAPGLYEMTIDEQIGEGVERALPVSFHERKMTDILAIDENDAPTSGTSPPSRGSRNSARSSTTSGLRPLVQSWVTPQVAELAQETHPARVVARDVRRRQPADEGGRGTGAEGRGGAAARRPGQSRSCSPRSFGPAASSKTFDFMRDFRDAMYELTFFGIYGSPAMLRLGEKFAFERTRKDPKALRFLPEVQAVLLNIDRGGFEEAVIRMLILMAESRATVRRDRLERSAKVLGHDEPFASLGGEKRAALIHEQSLIVEFERDRAIETLPELLPDMEDRQRAIEVVEYIAGAIEEMEPATIQLVQRFHGVLGLKGLALPAPRQDPLSASGTVRDELGEPVPLEAAAAIAPEAVTEPSEPTKPRGRGHAREAAE